MIDVARALPYVVTSTSPDETGARSPFSGEDAIVVRSWTADLGVSYVVEEEDALSFVRWRDLEGEPLESLHARALSNLLARAATHLVLKAEGPIVGVFLDGKLDASVLLLDEPWEHEEIAKLGSPLVAIAAARDAVAVASGASPDGIGELRAVADRVPEPARLSRNVLVRDARAWIPWD